MLAYQTANISQSRACNGQNNFQYQRIPAQPRVFPTLGQRQINPILSGAGVRRCFAPMSLFHFLSYFLVYLLYLSRNQQYSFSCFPISVFSMSLFLFSCLPAVLVQACFHGFSPLGLLHLSQENSSLLFCQNRLI